MASTATDAAWQWWRSIGSPKHVCAPMVNNSELAFRLLVRQYGVQLTYTPMLNAKSFAQLKTEEERRALVEPHPLDRPLIVQFCSDDPEELLAAALLVQESGWCDAVDLNLGCPQSQAVRDHYGSILMEEPELVQRIVRRVSAGLRIPFTCKIRVFEDAERTVAFARMIEDSGCSMLTVHGRTRGCTHHEGDCDWQAVRAVKAALSIPVLANGGPVRTRADVSECLRTTGCDGVMSAIGLLLDPHLFGPRLRELAPGAEESAARDPEGARDSDPTRDPTRDPEGRPDAILLALEYLEMAESVPSTPPKSMRDHCQALLRPFLSPRVPSARPADTGEVSSCPPGPATAGSPQVPPLPHRPPPPAALTAASRAPAGTPSPLKLQKLPPRGHPDIWSVLCANSTTSAWQCRLLVLHLAARLRHRAAPAAAAPPLPSLRQIKRSVAGPWSRGGEGEGSEGRGLEPEGLEDEDEDEEEDEELRAMELLGVLGQALV